MSGPPCADLALARSDLHRRGRAAGPSPTCCPACWPTRRRGCSTSRTGGRRSTRGRPARPAPTEPADDPVDRAAYLGEDDAGAPYVGVRVDEPGEGWVTLREVGARLDDREAGLLAEAVALANWHAAHPRCPRCGAPTEPGQAGWTRVCTNEGSEHYPRTDPAVIMAVVDDDDRLLLGHGAPVAGRAACRRSPGSSSPGSRSRRPYAARSTRRSASGSARSSTAAASPGRSPRRSCSASGPRP